ncbi:Gap junction alpha-9 protein [Merluccius polli]|uniref:Gap junction protein n=1 Tax=Merluccius polli TaxID=89951 RepID=A0AA47MRA6_MERPO|nr:Gap junction alpha-9 protein [Merluccius polli]
MLQVIFVSSPSLVYMGHALYRLRALEKARQRKKALLRRELDSLDTVETVEVRRRIEREMKQVDQGKLNKAPLRGSLLRTYVAHVFTRSAVEVAFMTGQYLLYGFHLQPLFQCEREPCPNMVDCYISRPTEKSVFMVFMQCIAGVSLFLNILEITHLGYKKVKKGILNYYPHLRGERDELLDDYYPNNRYKKESVVQMGVCTTRKATIASAPSDYNLLLERVQCSNTYPNLLNPSAFLPLQGGEKALLRALDDPDFLVPTENDLNLAKTSTEPALEQGDSLSPGSHQHHEEEEEVEEEEEEEEEGGGDEEEDEDTSEADLPGGVSLKHSREARHTSSCPTLQVGVARRQWTRCSTVMESKSSDTDSYGEAKTTAGSGAGHPAAWNRSKSDAKRPSPRPSTPESHKDSSSGSQHSPRPLSSNRKTSMASNSSSKRAPDLHI